MSVVAQVRSLSGRRPLAALLLVVALTLLFWALALAGGRDQGWSPPAGADVALWVHLGTALPALPLGAVILWRRKGDVPHRLLGRLWAAMMVVTALSSFWLQGLSGGFSLIHIFSVLTLVSIPLAVWHIRRGNVRAHLNAMRGVYIGLVAAGLLAALPGRVLHHVLFG